MCATAPALPAPSWPAPCEVTAFPLSFCREEPKEELLKATEESKAGHPDEKAGRVGPSWEGISPQALPPGRPYHSLTGGHFLVSAEAWGSPHPLGLPEPTGSPC